MADNQCISYKVNGSGRCTNPVKENDRCGVHAKSYRSRPNHTEIAELKGKHLYQRNVILETPMTQEEERAVMLDQHGRTCNVEITHLKARHAAMIAATGVDPDALYIEQRQRIRLHREVIRQRALEQIAARRMNALRDEIPEEILDFDEAPPAAPPRRGVTLGNFARDNQNIHTLQAVEMTKKTVKLIREKFPVPPEYQWNITITSKTPGEIIAECKLSIHASCQMLTKYSTNERIYDIEPGIYGKVLDSVWQFIKTSSDKDCLCAILKQEMEDNVGMCAQGNLTRICNIMGGYVDGVTAKESAATVLGRLLPPLMDEDDAETRLSKAKTILEENNIPLQEWVTWIDPLMDEFDDYETIMRPKLIV